MSTTPVPAEEHGFDLVELWRLLWGYRWLLIACGGVAAAIGVAIALTSEPYYRAEAVVAEVRDDGMGRAGGLASQLGGLATLAGVNFMGAGADDRNAMATLRSRFLAEEFIKRHKLLPVLTRNAKKPTLWFAVESLHDGIIQVREDKRSGVTTVSVEWRDAAAAARWANDYVSLANEMIRTRAIQEATRNVDYLNKQIAQTTVVELQKVMYNLIENETKTLMLANARTEYAFKVVDPAVEPQLRVRPKRTVIVLMAGMLGGALGLLILFVHRTVKRVRARL